MVFPGCSQAASALIFDQVVGEDAVVGPDPGAFGAVDAGAVPSVAAFEGADPAFASGAPFDGAAERSSVLLGLSGLGGSAFARDDDVAHAEVMQCVVDAALAEPRSAVTVRAYDRCGR